MVSQMPPDLGCKGKFVHPAGTSALEIPSQAHPPPSTELADVEIKGAAFIAPGRKKTKHVLAVDKTNAEGRGRVPTAWQQLVVKMPL